MNKNRWFSILAVLGLFAATILTGPSRTTHAADDSRTFPETGKTVSGKFLDYWNSHGGLAQQGYPISEEMDEMSDTDGKTYTVQYFERSVFELHPENAAPYDVLLSLLGVSFYADKYNGNAPGQKASTTNARKFTQTGKTIGGVFRTYWEQHGGLAQQGYPISDEFNEKNDTDGKTYKVQYFERAVFEYHPENAGKNGEVLLSLLGKFQLDFKSGGGGTTTPPATAPTAGLTVKGWTHVVVFPNNVALFYNKDTHDVITAKVNDDGSLTPLRTKDQLPTFSTVTQIVPGPENTVFFYNRADGACSLATVTDDGNFVTKFVYRPFSAFWDIIALDTVTHKMVFYSNDDSTEGVANLNLNNGEVETLKSYPGTAKPGDFRWSFIQPIGNAVWAKYVRGNGQFLTYKYNADGSGVTLKAVEIARTWTNLASQTLPGISFLYFYDKTNGAAMTGLVDTNGTFSPIKNYTGISKEWTHLTSGSNGVFLIYSSETGNIATDKIDTNGAAVALKRYSPAK